LPGEDPPFQSILLEAHKIKAIHLATAPDSRFVLFSDAHRGDGSGADDFAANSLIFKCALDHYLAQGFTLIELGDGEELWENGDRYHFSKRKKESVPIFPRPAAPGFN